MTANPPTSGRDRVNAAQTLQQGMLLHQQGNLKEAERLYSAVHAASPRLFDAQYLLGVLRMHQGRKEDALALLAEAVAQKPDSPQALAALAATQAGLGRHQDALANFDKIVKLSPRDADAIVNRGMALVNLGRYEEAVADYRQAIAVVPNHRPAMFQLVLVLAELNRDDEALVECDALLALEPDNTDALNNRGNLLAALGRHAEAIAVYDRVLELDPDYVAVIDNRGNALRALGRHDEALAAHDAALARKPNNADALNNRGAVLVDLQRPLEALQCFDRALALQPDDIDMINNRGIALLMLQRFEEVLENAGRALRVDPNNAIAYTQRGTALQLAERYDEATQSLEKAIALEPDHSDAQYNKALLHLRSGAFAEGWDLYEQRWAALKTLVPRAYKQPRWNGEHVKGTLLAWAEQGLGDHILYSSMVPDLLQRADSVTLEIEPRLVPMFARSFPSVHVVPMNPDLHAGHADAHTPLAGAGRYLRKDWQAFPRRENGYLKADTAMTKTLRERLASDGRRLIGLSWRSHNPEIGAAKTALLTDFAPLFRLPNCRFVDLQYGDTLAERETLERDTGVVVEHVDEIDNTNDIDALAALVSACDAVVTVSNTTAHLAGALGKPTFVFVPYGSARLWYWFAERDDSPWYPRVHVARQRQSQSWAQLIAPAVQDIARSIEAS